MLTNENDIVNDQNNDTVSETKEMLNENANNTEEKNDTSNDESVEVLEKVDVKTKNISVENTVLNYLDPEILNVKEYTFDELNDNIEFSDSDELKDTKDIYDIKMEDVSEKQLVKGKVVAIYDKEVVVDIGFKSEGIIDKSEFESIPEIGSEIDVFLVVFEDRKGRLILSKRRADFEKRWSELRDLLRMKHF